MNATYFVLLLVTAAACGQAHKKYSAEANKKSQESFKEVEKSDFRRLEKPFRMAKINMLWSKAQVRLTEAKLKSLFSELKIHDKEEITWKRLKAEGKDKDGLLEADMRKRLIGIMSTYDLLDHFEDLHDPAQHRHHKVFGGDTEDYANKGLFKDKKLNKLWQKAEVSGFTAEELQALREEFQHHQEKIDQYYSLLSDAETRSEDDEAENSVDEKLDKFNAIAEKEEKPKDPTAKANLLRTHHRDLKDSYDRLSRIAAKGPNSREFVEPKVQGLWKLAVNSNFTADELASLKTELTHYESRLLKLRHLQAEATLGERHTGQKVSGHKNDAEDIINETIQKHARKVEKLHLHLQEKILSKHTEL